MIEKYSRAYAAIDLDAIRCNIEGMASKLTGGTKIIAVIKADGYGHGAVPIAKELEPLRDICGFAAATEEEAIILRMAGITKSILVLGYTFPYSYKEMVEKEISIAVFRHDTLKELSRAALEAGKKAKIHIKVDTGMSRIGIRPDEEGMKLVSEALEMPGIEIEGIFTHFARADEKDKTSARRQLSLFNDFVEKIRQERGLRIPICHCANSASMIELRDADMDAVRAGIAMYGLWPSQEVSRNIVGLKPAMELKSRIIYVKDVEAGAEIGYGGTFTASRKMKIATVPVGYGDGYPRGLSNKGYVLVHGKKAPIVGRICMDQFMIDVTQIPEIKEGDVATLIGREGELEITMEELGELSGRFNYELACCIGKRIPRVYLKSGKMVSAKDYFHDFE
jgi:alanine racemase